MDMASSRSRPPAGYYKAMLSSIDLLVESEPCSTHFQGHSSLIVQNDQGLEDTNIYSVSRLIAKRTVKVHNVYLS